MTRKQPKKARKIKKPFGADKEFPRKCNQCAKKQVVMKTIEYQADVRHDGRNYSFTIPNLEIMICEACGEKVFTERVDSQINAALRNHAKLLAPEEIRAGIKRIGMTQKEVARVLGPAEATMSRWLNETQIQSRAMDNLLRMFFAFRRARMILSSEEPDSSFGFVEYPPVEASQGSFLRETSVAPAVDFEVWSSIEAIDAQRCQAAQKEMENLGSSWAFEMEAV